MTSVFLEPGIPADVGVSFAGNRGNLPCTAHCEGIVVLDINLFLVGEALSRIFPGALFLICAVGAYGEARRAEMGVVVADDFDAAYIPFAGSQHVGAGPFQHGNKIGENVTLGVEVFGSAPVRGSLPAPGAQAIVVETSVALPEGDVPSLESAVEAALPDLFYELPACRDAPGAEPVVRRLPAVAEGRIGEIFEINRFAPDSSQIIRTDFIGPLLAQPCPEPRKIGLAPGIVSEFLREVKVQAVPALHRFVELDEGPYPEMLLGQHGDRVCNGLEGIQNGFLGICCEPREKCCGYKD